MPRRRALSADSESELELLRVRYLSPQSHEAHQVPGAPGWDSSLHPCFLGLHLLSRHGGWGIGAEARGLGLSAIQGSQKTEEEEEERRGRENSPTATHPSRKLV